MINMIKW